MANDYFDPVEAARRRLVPQTTGRSFFPAVNQRMFSAADDRGALLNDIDNSFYGGGQVAQPTPTPTPTPIPRSYFPAQPSRFTLPITPQYNFGMNNFGMNGRTNQDWIKQYGWSG